MVEPEDGQSPGLDTLSAHVRLDLADYKAPRRMVRVPSILRAPNGTVDYKRLKAFAIEDTAAAG